MNRSEVMKILVEDNPNARIDEIVMYADSFAAYLEARANIEKNGSIVMHPRTGQPIDNPYNKIKVSAMEQLRKVNRLLVVRRLWDEPAA